jgi:dienelactone hydrolase
MPAAAEIDKSPFAQAEKNNWGALWPLIASGQIQTHTYENAAVATDGARFPVILFSPAFGGDPCGYSHQIEELASRGYVVATVHHTYEVPVTAFSDGRMIAFSQENARGSEATTLDETLKWAEPRIDVWAADILFTLDQLTRLNTASAKAAPFAGRLDLARMGFLGHSFGGAVAARVCELDQRVKACVNQDGTLGGPIVHFNEGHLPSQPYLFLSSPMPGPPDDATLKSWGITRKQFEQDQSEAEAAHAKDFEDCCGGAYQASIQTAGFRHSSFTDIPLLRAAGNPTDAAKALHSLKIIESYTIAFFDKFLKEAHGTLLDRAPKDRGVQIKHYGR